MTHILSINTFSMNILIMFITNNFSLVLNENYVYYLLKKFFNWNL